MLRTHIPSASDRQKCENILVSLDVVDRKFHPTVYFKALLYGNIIAAVLLVQHSLEQLIEISLEEFSTTRFACKDAQEHIKFQNKLKKQSEIIQNSPLPALKKLLNDLPLDKMGDLLQNTKFTPKDFRDIENPYTSIN